MEHQHSKAIWQGVSEMSKKVHKVQKFQKKTDRHIWMFPSQSIKLLRAFWSKFNTLVVSCNYCWKVTATYIVHTAVHVYVVIHVHTKKTSARCSTPPALLLSLSKYSFSNDGLIMSQRQVKSHREKKKEKEKNNFPRANLNRYVVCIYPPPRHFV